MSGMTPLSESLPGTWSLVSRIDVAASGVPHPDPALGSDPVALLVYDRAGRLTWHADGAGAVTQQVYDKNGNLIKQIQYATAISSSSSLDSVAASSGDRITDRIYDAANRVVYSIDALGTITWTGYDKNSNVVIRWTVASPTPVPSKSSARCRR